MATNGGQSSPLAGNGDTSFDKEHSPHDPEKQDEKQQAMANKYGKEDPFGDESNSEVKYKTMKWWYAFPILQSRPRTPC